MHKGKSKKDKNLIFLEKKEDETPLMMAFRIISMYEKDFNLTIKDISQILLCERQWVIKNIRDNVKHIFLNDKYRKFLNEVSNEHEVKSVYLNDYYYFSKTDFLSWLKNNTVMTRQTIRLDISKYSNDIIKFKEITHTYREEIKLIRKSSKEFKEREIKYQYDIQEILNDVGKRYLNSSVNATKRNAKELIINNEMLPETFTSIKVLKTQMDRSLEIVYRRLYEIGAIKYTIANSLVRYDANPSIIPIENESVIVTIPYEIYIAKNK